MPRLSVVMSVLNGERYIEEALRGIAAQTFRDFELIIVNDGSTDRTLDIIQRFGDARIRLLDNERNMGVAPSANRGIAAATGEYLARHDADDRSAPARFARQIDWLDTHPETLLLGSGYREIAPSGGRLSRHHLPTTDLEIRWAMLFYCPFAQSAVMWRREPVRLNVGGYDESLRYSEDFDLWLRIAEHGELANLAKPLVEIRTHADSMTARAPEAAAHGHRVRLHRRAELLGLDPKDARSQARAKTVSDLLFGWPVHETLSVIEQGLADLASLHAAFVSMHAVPEWAAKPHLAGVERTLAERLLALAGGRAAAGTGDAGALASTAFHLSPITAVSPEVALRLGARVLRRLLPGRTTAALRAAPRDGADR